MIERGKLIEHHTQLLRLFSVIQTRDGKHPHAGCRVYISRKALKHFVERRSDELHKHHNSAEVMRTVNFALDRLQETIITFDTYIHERPDKHFYQKDFSHEGKANLRILLEEKGGILQVKSIHFRKRGRK